MSPWSQNDNRLPQTRLTVIAYIIVGLMALLLLGFWKLQIINSDRYAQLAERNRVRSIPIIAPRGTMLDRYGRVIVDNYPSFSVLLLRDDPQQLDRLLPQIADGLSLTPGRYPATARGCQNAAALSAHRDQTGSHAGRHRFHRIASRRYSRAGNAHGAPPPVSPRRLHGPRERLRGRSELGSDRGERWTLSPWRYCGQGGTRAAVQRSAHGR